VVIAGEFSCGEAVKLRSVDFDDQLVVVEFDIWQDTAHNTWTSCNARLHKKCNNSHDHSYRHTKDIASICRHPNREARRAGQIALEWRQDIEYYVAHGSRRDRNEKRGRTTEFVPMQLRLDEIENPIAAATEMSEMHRWMADTGCCFDLISRDDLTRDEIKRSVKAQVPCRLKTASGDANANKTISSVIAPYKERLRPIS
jgi:hypothetical protein